MTAVHIVLGVAVVAVNLAAGAYGAWAWWLERARPGSGRCCAPARRSWRSRRRSARSCSLQDEPLPPLHLVYGLAPLAVAFLAEQLRLVAAQTELDRRGLEGRAAVAALSEPEREGLVRAIVRREVGVMAPPRSWSPFSGYGHPGGSEPRFPCRMSLSNTPAQAVV